jgi:phosphoethanolamine N-methyltransferase
MVKLTAAPDEREVMKEFWMQHSHQASVEEMMLDSQAHIISKKDTPEILSYMPSLKGKRVLELGAGIGMGSG